MPKAVPAFGVVSEQQGGTITNIDGIVSSMTGPGIGQGPNIPGAGTPVQMGPGLPPQNMPLGGDPRLWAYRVGWNLPGAPGEGRVSYATIRDVSRTEWLTRKAIEVRKSQIHNLKLDIVAKDRKSHTREKEIMDRNGKRIQEVKDFFKKPDGRHSFHGWLEAILEDHLVYDAVGLEKVRNQDPDLGPKHPTEDYRLGKLIALEHVDSTTIKPLIDDGGRQPLPPLPSFQQYLYGVPRASFSSQEFLYLVKNVRNDTPYGFSPVEQFLFMVNIVLRYWSYVGAKYTDGTLPEGIGEAPPNWTTAQIAELNEYWDSLLAGDPRALRKLHFVPGGFKWHQFKDSLFDEKFAKLLIEMTAIAFDVTPQEMGFTLGSRGVSVGGKSQGESAEELSFRRGPEPLINWLIAVLLNPILEEEFGGDELEWVISNDSDLKEEDHMKALDTAIKGGVIPLDQAIEETGGEPIGVGRIFALGQMVLGEPDLRMISQKGWPAFQKAVANAMPAPAPGQDNGKPLNMQQGKPGFGAGHSNSGPGSPSNPSTEPERASNAMNVRTQQASDGTHHFIGNAKSAEMSESWQDDIKLFERKAVKAFKLGKSAAVRFQSESIPATVIEKIRAKLVDAKSVDAVRESFTEMARFTAMVKVAEAVNGELGTRNARPEPVPQNTQPIIHIDVHEREQKPAQVSFNPTIKVSQPKAPNVDVTVKAPEIHNDFKMPAQKIEKALTPPTVVKPEIHIHNDINVPPATPAQVIMQAAEEPKNVDFKFDSRGNITGIEKS